MSATEIISPEFRVCWRPIKAGVIMCVPFDSLLLIVGAPLEVIIFVSTVSIAMGVIRALLWRLVPGGRRLFSVPEGLRWRRFPWGGWVTVEWDSLARIFLYSPDSSPEWDRAAFFLRVSLHRKVGRIREVTFLVLSARGYDKARKVLADLARERGISFEG